MKQAWTRLARFLDKDVSNSKHKEGIFENLFARHHNNASEVVYSKEGKILAAVYFTPNGMNQEELKNLMRSIRDRVCYSGDGET